MRNALILFILFFSSAAFCQEASITPSFSFETLSFQTQPFSKDSCRVDVYVAVPYSILTFLNAVENYVADYSVDILITPKNEDKGGSSKVESFSIALPSGEWEKLHELDLTRADASQFSFALKQGGHFDVRILIIDLTTKKQRSLSSEIATPTFTPLSPSISTPLLYRSKFGSRITPHIGAEASTLDPNQAGFFVELYNTAQSVPLWFMQRLRTAEGDGEEIARNVKVLVSSGEKRMPVFIPFLDDDLWTGKYILETYLFSDPRDTASKDTAKLMKDALSFHSRPITISEQRGIPLAGVDIDDAVQQLTYIAIGSAYDSLMRADTKAEKRRAITEFWAHQNPYPSDPYNRPMQIFYRRLTYVNQNFKGSLPGWRTDRGRVYLQLGEPTNMEKHPYEVNQRPYEIWDYYDLNSKFYFVDQYLIGDYRLATLPPANGIFNWQRER